MIHTGRIIYDGSMHGLKTKYGRMRRIDLTASGSIPDLRIPGLEVLEKDSGRLSLSFDQNQISSGKVLSLITSRGIDIQDIVIRDADIEEVIREVFASQEGNAT